jgi:hypothetical protein
MLYRSLLRWTRSTPVKDAAFDLPLLDSALESRWPTTPVCSAAGVAAAVRSAFREEVADPEAGVAQAFVLLRSLQGYTQHIEELAKQRADHSDRAGVAYSVGEVLRHKQFAFRGVVMGWGPAAAGPEQTGLADRAPAARSAAAAGLSLS